MSHEAALTVQPRVCHAQPFDAIAADYDSTFTDTAVGIAQRAQVALELNRCFHAGQHILELNCGTGHDALALARRGVKVTALDASPSMIAVARNKLATHTELSNIDFRVLRNEDLRSVSESFDGAFSNFAGLNCSRDWSAIASELRRLIRPGGHLLLCIMGRCCVWEILGLLIAGKPSKAIRRFSSSRTAQIAGQPLDVYYPSVSQARHAFRPDFALNSWRGIGAFVPPSYFDSTFQSRPQLLRSLQRLDLRLTRLSPLRSFADHILLDFVRTAK